MQTTRVVAGVDAVARQRLVARVIVYAVTRMAAGMCALVSVLSAQPSSKIVDGLPTLRGFAATPTVSMRIYVPAGRVRIVVWDRDSITVRGTIGREASMFGGGDRSHVKLGVENIRTGDTKLPEADWLVTVPRKAHVWVKVTNGVIETDGTAGELELYAVGGRIAVTHATGVTSVESIDATVHINSTSGDLRVRGGKAALLLRDVTGTASIATVSGKVTITGTAPECRVETIGGDIAFAVPALRGAIVELQSHSGAIAITLNGKHTPLLDLSSRSGVVTQPSRKGSALEGRIVARSFKGAITVHDVK